jgi:hypothetical protein
MAFQLLHLLESFLDALVCIPEAFFKAKNLLPDYREAKMARLDNAGVDWSYWNLMDSIALHLDERVRLRGDRELFASVEIPP